MLVLARQLIRLLRVNLLKKRNPAFKAVLLQRTLVSWFHLISLIYLIHLTIFPKDSFVYIVCSFSMQAIFESDSDHPRPKFWPIYSINLNFLVNQIFSMGCLRTGASAKKNEKFVEKTYREIWNKVKDNGPVLQKCGERYCYACYSGKK